MRRGLTLVAVCALSACGGEDSGGDGMAEEIGGECVFTPGQYIARYEVLEQSAGCDGIGPLPDEYMTVTEAGEFVGVAAPAPVGCVDGETIVRGCFVASSRECTLDTDDGTVVANTSTQVWFDDGEIIGTVAAHLYIGTTLVDSCTTTQGGTIRRR